MSSVFIASSTEGRAYAEMAASELKALGAIPTVWWSDRVFPAGLTLIESLWRIAAEVDAVLIIATPDDHTSRRGASQFSANGNVLLEYGIFAGHLGRSNVAILEVGNVTLPSDLAGVKNLRTRGIAPEDDPTTYSTVELRGLLREWIRAIDAGSGDGARLARLLAEIAPRMEPQKRLDLKFELLTADLDVEAFPKLPPTSLEHLILKHTRSSDGETVGYATKLSTVLQNVDYSAIVPDSPDERSLAGHLARYVAELVAAGDLSPTLLAVSKTSSRMLHIAANMLPFPIVTVNTRGPNPGRPIEGYFERGDRAALLHDVALTGSHLVDCVTTLRSAGIECNQLIALTRHEGAASDLRDLMRHNRIAVRTASAFMPDVGRVVCGDMPLSASPHLSRDCAICDVVEGRDDAPLRSFVAKDQLHSEILEDLGDFVVISDVSPLTPGHVLVVTKRHSLAMGKLPPAMAGELDTIYRQVQSRLRDLYGGQVACFEHGLCDRSQATGCGIDHAHLHLVPGVENFEDRFAGDFDVKHISSFADLPSIVGAQGEYLLYLYGQGSLSVAFPPTPTRQYFRRVVSEITGRDLWNWNDDLIVGSVAEKTGFILDLHSRWRRDPTS